MLATPWGFRDILPEEALVRERIARTVTERVAAHGYLPVETPLLEDRSALEASGGRNADTPFKLFDDDGRLLVVRHDNTLPIVRLVSSRLATSGLPLRLRYRAPVVRERARLVGAARQFTQLGFELIGEPSATGDRELVSIVAEALDALGITGWRLVCGSVRPFMALLDACGDADLAADALRLVHANNFVDLDARVAASQVPAPVKRAISALPRQHGGPEVLDAVDELLAAAGVEGSATHELRALVAAFSTAVGASVPMRADALSFDFSIMNSFDYYTGLVFKAYAPGLSDPVGSGGRYDRVFDGVFAASDQVPAAGFAFSLERLEDACQMAADVATALVGVATADSSAPAAETLPGTSPQGGSSADTLPAVAPVGTASARTATGPLRIAVPKGSLKEGTIAALEAAGIDASEFREPGRRLIVPAVDHTPVAEGSLGEIELVIVRATDAPAFVACGGADCGFCGRDSLIEADLDLLELVDMGYGECRYIEAEPEGRAERTARAYARRGTLRVATKYPQIAAAWYAQRGVAADIIALHGNIELGPIVGMSDRIVDITATGTTLRENHLVITGEIMTCTARFFANPGRSRLDPRVRALGERLAAVAPVACS